MKKRIVIISVITLIVASILIDIFIPTQLKIANTSLLKNTQKSVVRFLSSEKGWTSFFMVNFQNKGGTAAIEQHVFLYNSFDFMPSPLLNTTANILIKTGKDSIDSRMLFLQLGKDSMAMEWSCNLTNSINPLTRLQQYLKARKIKTTMHNLMVNFKNYVADEKNITGFIINKQIVSDTFFVAKKAMFTSYPTTKEVYNLIGSIKEYATSQNAKVNGYPMLNVHMIDTLHYEAMAALPINKILAGNTDMAFKRMVRGEILVSEIEGGNYTIINAFQTMQNYVNDHGYTEIAIPFQSLITDRQNQPDTAQWITKLYYPVF